MTKKIKKPWPTKDAMNQVYEMNLWGTNGDSFYSGEGSHHPEIITPYLKVVTSFLQGFTPPLVVCDLGCGDFNIGVNLVEYTKQYIAVDIVENLIARNKKTFKDEKLAFTCLNIAEDNLPQADCVIIRQVLQHLSNKEIQAIVKKLYNYKYVLVTEHLPEEDFTPNIDIISGQGIRLKKKSGVNLLKSPFHFKVKSVKELTTVNLTTFKGKIVTTLYQVF